MKTIKRHPNQQFHNSDEFMQSLEPGYNSKYKDIARALLNATWADTFEKVMQYVLTHDERDTLYLRRETPAIVHVSHSELRHTVPTNSGFKADKTTTDILSNLISSEAVPGEFARTSLNVVVRKIDLLPAVKPDNLGRRHTYVRAKVENVVDDDSPKGALKDELLAVREALGINLDVNEHANGLMSNLELGSVIIDANNPVVFSADEAEILQTFTGDELRVGHLRGIGGSLL